LTAFDLSLQGRTLIARAIRGDHEGLRELWNEHRRWVAAILLAHMPRTGGPELDDLLQEVAVAVVAKISGLRDEAAFKPWLRAVAMSIAKTSGRRTKVRKAGWLKLVGFAGDDERTESEQDVGPGSARAEVLSEGRRLMALAAELPDGYREPLLLKCVQGMSYKQIGQVMGLPDTTIETRIARGRRMLRERAEAEAGATTPDQQGVKVGEP
jgi:RNA polymerase sigma-70 factor (ECF subfamily)